MPLALDQSLAKLCRLSPQGLHRTTRRVRAELGGVEWKMALCLLAAMRQSSFLALGYKSLSQYAEYGLQLSGKKLRALLGVARALEHLPLMSEAFQAGKIGWGKLRALQSLVTPETEAQWLEFAMKKRTDQVVRMVSLSPTAWKGQRALQASLEGQPLATSEQVESLLSQSLDVTSANPLESLREGPAPGNSARGVTPSQANSSCVGQYSPAPCAGQSHDAPYAGQSNDAPCAGPSDASTCDGRFSLGTGGGQSPCEPGKESGNTTLDRQASPCPSPPFAAPRTIRVVFELTPDQFAVYERAETRLRARLGKRVNRAEVLVQLAQANLEAGSSRSRAKHQIVIVKAEQGEGAWYDTSRGLLPVDPGVLAELEKKTGQSRGRGGTEAVAAFALQGKPCSRGRKAAPEPSGDEQRVSPAAPSAAPPAAPSAGPAAGPAPPPWSPTTEAPAGSARESISVTHEAPKAGAESHELARKQRDESGRGGDCCRPSMERTRPASATSSRGDGDQRGQRVAVPAATLRALFTRAGHRCEECGQTGPLEVHHKKRVSRGGGNDLADLEAVCKACHRGEHEHEFATRPGWRHARAPA
jgi:5-methylcytosine-specific restriction endonuclease McrA